MDFIEIKRKRETNSIAGCMGKEISIDIFEGSEMNLNVDEADSYVFSNCYPVVALVYLKKIFYPSSADMLPAFEYSYSLFTSFCFFSIDYLNFS